MRLVSHPNVVDLKAFFYTNGEKVRRVSLEITRLTRQKDELYLNLVLEFVPETVYRASRHYSKLKQVMPMLQVKLYMYQVSPLAYNGENSLMSSCSDRWPISTLSVSVIETSNPRTFSSTPLLVSSCCVISDPPRFSLLASQTSAISAPDTTELQS